MKKSLYIIAFFSTSFFACVKSAETNVTPEVKATSSPVQVDGQHINAPTQVGVAPTPIRG